MSAVAPIQVTRRTRVAVVILVAVVAAALVGAAVVAGLGSHTDRRGWIWFRPGPAPAAPSADLAWWEPVHGEPLGVAVDGDDVAVAALDEVRLVDGVTGRNRWTATVPGVRRYRPALGGDRVAATTESELVVLDRDDGTRVATVTFAGPGPAAVLASPGPGGVILAGSEAGQVLAVDAEDGSLRWSVAYPGRVTVAPHGDAMTVVAAWHGGPDPALRAFDVRSGALVWQMPLGPVAGPPLLTDDAVLVVHGAGIHSAVAQSLDLATGRSRWEATLPGWWEEEIEGIVERPSAPSAALSTALSTAYLLDGMGTVTALDPASGALRWRRETGRPLVACRLVLTPSAVVFASYDDELMVLDRSDGRLRSAVPQGGVVADLATVTGRLVTALRLGAPSRIEARPEP